VDSKRWIYNIPCNPPPSIIQHLFLSIRLIYNPPVHPSITIPYSNSPPRPLIPLLPLFPRSIRSCMLSILSSAMTSSTESRSFQSHLYWEPLYLGTFSLASFVSGRAQPRSHNENDIPPSTVDRKHSSDGRVALSRLYYLSSPDFSLFLYYSCNRRPSCCYRTYQDCLFNQILA
jgi:hypothetical protein